MIKTKQDNDMIVRMGTAYVKNKTKLSWPIRRNVVCDKNQIGQWCDRTYICDLWQKRYWTVVIDYGLWWKPLWPIVQVRSTQKMTLSYHDQLDRMHSAIKTTQGNNVIDHRGLVYVENETKLS